MNKYLIVLSTPRSGSSLLASLIKNFGICDCYEHQLHYKGQDLTKDLFIDLREKYIKNERYPYGGIKILSYVFSHINGYFGNIFNYLETDKENIHFVYTYREDLYSQLISYYMALRTDYWFGDSYLEHKEKYDSLIFDYDRIKKLEGYLKDELNMFSNFFEINKIEPFKVSYEQLNNDKFHVFNELCNQFNLEKNGETKIKPENRVPKQIYPEGLFEDFVNKYKKIDLEKAGV